MRALGLGLSRSTSSPLGLKSSTGSLRDLEGLASRLEVAVKPPAFNIGPDLDPSLTSLRSH
jgi:hypothetical protein